MQVSHDDLRLFPGLGEDKAARARLKEKLQAVTLPANQVVFRPGSGCEHFIMVLDGSVKVTLSSANGREVVLYRVEPGGTCILTTACLFSQDNYPAEGRTETEVSALIMSPDDFQLALSECATFRSFVFSSLGQRFSDMMLRIETLSSQPIDLRLASALLKLMNEQQTVLQTHQLLATELGSVREVVSRHLKRFEHAGWISQSRGHIDILDIAALKKMTE